MNGCFFSYLTFIRPPWSLVQSYFLTVTVFVWLHLNSAVIPLRIYSLGLSRCQVRACDRYPCKEQRLGGAYCSSPGVIVALIQYPDTCTTAWEVFSGTDRTKTLLTWVSIGHLWADVGLKRKSQWNPSSGEHECVQFTCFFCNLEEY